ncbi:MAG: SusD/RagB family nutrient-binding outer membrane lipoprotein [Bacteroidia bacterium]
MKKYIIMGLALFAFSACQDLSELNKDIKNPESVPAGTLFANATVTLFDFMTDCNVNVNNFRLWAQQWAQTTYADESNYELIERNVNGRAWNTLYAEVIRDLRDAKRFIGENDLLSASAKDNQLAIAEVLEIYATHVLVDIFGDVPYTEAFGDDVTPAYDDDAAIYSDLISRLDAAIAKLGGDSGLGSYDLVYGGDADMWKKFANSLKLRMAIRIADSNEAKARTMVTEAVASGVFIDNSENFQLTYESATPNTNPLWESLIQSGRSDYVVASTLVDPMQEMADPRVNAYFKDPRPVTDTTTGQTVYVFVGGVYGDNNNFNAHSHPGEMQEDPTFPGIILSYWEVAFLLADASERGFATGGTAESFYNAGIQASILYWGGSQTDVDTYLANPAVSYGTAAGTWKQKIALQKLISLYDQGFEAWSSYRLYDYPEFPIAVQAGIPTPTRYIYPVTEASLNGENKTNASNAIGGDKLDTKVFWDVN